MKPPLLYRFSEPSARLKKARLDNIALVPASLLPFKAAYQREANHLPMGSVLCVSGTLQQQKIFASVTKFFENHGHNAFILPLERITTKKQPPRPAAETLKLAF